MTDMMPETKTKKECEGMEEVSLAYQKEEKKKEKKRLRAWLGFIAGDDCILGGPQRDSIIPLGE